MFARRQVSNTFYTAFDRNLLLRVGRRKRSKIKISADADYTEGVFVRHRNFVVKGSMEFSHSPADCPIDPFKRQL